MSDQIHIALSGMKVARQQTEVITQNLANANTDGYERVELRQIALFQQSNPSGVDIAGVQNATNNFLNKELFQGVAANSYDQKIAEYYDRIELLMGKPGDDNNMSAYLANCLNSLSQLSTHPNRASLRAGLLYDTQQLAEVISNTAQSLQQLRFNADADLRTAVFAINNTMNEISELNNKIACASEGSIENAGISSAIRNKVRELARYFDIRCNYNEKGQVSIDAINGTGLLGPDVSYQIKYDHVHNLDDLIGDQPFDPFYVTVVDSTGKDLNANMILISGGTTSEREHSLRSGYIAALADIRDINIPTLLNQLDTFAYTLKNEFNKIHNEGNGFPPPSTLSGRQTVAYDQDLGFTGSVLISIVDDLGNQLPAVPALTIDFDQLDTGDGPGHANVRGVMQEIEYFFGSSLNTDNQVSIGNIADIKLVSSSKALQVGNVFNLDLEVENISGSNSTLTILGVSAQDNLGNNILGGAQLNNPYTFNSGELTRTTSSIPAVSINPVTSDGLYPYTISLQVQVYDGAQNYYSTIDYLISNPVVDPINGLYNTRFDASTATSDGTVIAPTVNSQYMSAMLVDDNGMPVPVAAGKSGRLVLSTGNNSWHIAMNQLDSSQSIETSENIPATNLSFSAFLGLNDFFVSNAPAGQTDSIANSAYYLGIRKDILKDTRFISAGLLSPCMQNNDPLASPNYSYELSAGDGSVLRELAALSDKTVLFAANGSMPDLYSTLYNYANEMNTYTAMQISNSHELLSQSEDVVNALMDKINDIVGVDINTEMAKLLVFQELFTSSAYAMKTAQEMFQILTQMMMR